MLKIVFKHHLVSYALNKMFNNVLSNFKLHQKFNFKPGDKFATLTTNIGYINKQLVYHDVVFIKWHCPDSIYISYSKVVETMPTFLFNSTAKFFEDSGAVNTEIDYDKQEITIFPCIGYSHERLIFLSDIIDVKKY